ncbi:hypothetical protein C7974DRAFT_317816 [Boeremia exigua]|uniref:uncharacterized protein n=1 Tax=Boeremia exigua TaxID=749465 RepID=UPI001E8D8AA1|nr:uncharacterized protein C7974DRAFT_317816 [Boeremia exigua]KAH6618495.1 hypothetical protein C7974DRAFT_317816 [Boeremia exigua]
MPQTLYRFGVDPADPTVNAAAPVPVITNTKIKILWSSWCDLIYTTLNRDRTRSIIYLGTSLNPAQQLDLQSRASSPAVMGQYPSKPGEHLHFFGAAMHDGVRGYVADSMMCSDSSLLLVCNPKLVTEPGEEEPEPDAIVSSGKGGLECCKVSALAMPRTRTISCVRDLQGLRDYCAAETPIECAAQFAPIQLVVNATTATALDQGGRVHTRTTDPRYPTCLGRPYTGTSNFEPVPYLSETRIIKIASGGYITAAVSEDGELFLWGQASPGTVGELGVLHRSDYSTDIKDNMGNVIWADSVQDEDIKCLNIYIDGKAASAYDVAVGFGHVLVAARNEVGEHAVFAAGCGEQGQLGLGRSCDFQQEFEEVVSLRGKQTSSLVAAGWSSHVVAEG